jgi:hypothetical protein
MAMRGKANVLARGCEKENSFTGTHEIKSVEKQPQGKLYAIGK